jgi:hypothetical protein
MGNPYRPETLRGMAATNKLQIATLIGALWRSVEVLTVARHGKLPPRRHEELPPPWIARGESE